MKNKTLPLKPTREAIRLYDDLCELVHAIKDDFEATREMRALARKGRATLNDAKAVWYSRPA